MAKRELSMMETGLREESNGKLFNICPNLQILSKAFASLRLSDTVGEVDLKQVLGVLDSLEFVLEDTESEFLDSKSSTTPNREEIQLVEGILVEFENEEEEEGVSYELLEETADRHGVDEVLLDTILRTLRDRGDIYKPSNDRYANLDV